MATTKPTTAPAAATPDSGAPAQAGLVLGTLIIVAAVVNLPLAMANVALPSIGAYFQASQTQLNLVAVGYSLGLACSVLWLGALGDRYGRKLLAMLGVIMSMPAALIAGLAVHRSVDLRPVAGWFCSWYGLPDDSVTHRSVVGTGARAFPQATRVSSRNSPNIEGRFFSLVVSPD